MDHFFKTFSEKQDIISITNIRLHPDNDQERLTNIRYADDTAFHVNINELIVPDTAFHII